MDYLTLKWLHVLSSTVLFGTGIGTAFGLFVASLRRDRAALAAVTRSVVLADWLFTTPAVIVQPVTGYWLASMAGMPWTRGWLLVAGLVYALAILCWLPVVVIQWRMRALFMPAGDGDRAIPARYWTLFAWWVALGSVALCCFVVLFRLMVMKHP